MKKDTPNQTFLQEDSKKDKPWDEHREHAQTVDRMLSCSPMNRYSERINDCSRYLSFGVDSEGVYHLSNAFFCKVRTCPVCQWRRSLRNYARFMGKIPSILESYPNLRFLHLILTVENPHVEDLRTTLKDMSKAWKRVKQSVRFTSAVEGYIRATEVTRKRENGTAHPHYHVLLAVKPSYFKHKGIYITHAEWQELWRRSARLNYMPDVFIRKVTDFKAAAHEVLKYATKPEDLTQDRDWLIEYVKQVSHLRFIDCGGCLAGILKDEITNDEMIHVEEEKNTAEDEIKELRCYDWNGENYIKNHEKKG